MDAHLVVFKLTNELYGVDIYRVQSIIPMLQVTAVPGTPSFIEGIINLRGALVPVVDLRRRFDLPLAAEGQKRVVVIVELEGLQVGMIVDKVTEVRKISGAAIEPTSPFLASIDTAYLQGIAKVDEQMIIMLDLDRIFAPHEHQVLKQAA
jgi:purine-binding chemotaxis protein CheW